MSKAPTFSLKLVKDFTFKETFNLTHTQTDVMAYIVNLPNWAYSTTDGYYLCLTQKIMSDLGLGLKTVEASLLQLKNLNLIETKLLKVEKWCSDIKHRYTKITAKGRTYDSAFFPLKESQKLDNLEAENKNLREKIKLMEEVYKEEPKNSKKESLEFETIEKLRSNLSKTYRKNKKPICNNVLNSSWLPKTEFHINNYGNLSVLTPNKEFKQVDNNNEVNQFWQWLFENQNRIGVIEKNLDNPNISSLLKYIGEKFKLNNETICTVKEIFQEKGEIAIHLKDEQNNIINLASSKRLSKLHTLQEAKEILNKRVIFV